MPAALNMTRLSLPGIHQPVHKDKVLDVCRRDSDIRQLVDGEIRRTDALKAPDNSSGSPVIFLISTGVVTVHVVALQPPGEILEGQSVVRPAAYVNCNRVV